MLKFMMLFSAVFGSISSNVRKRSCIQLCLPGLLAQETLDRALPKDEAPTDGENLEFLLDIEALDERFVTEARQMAYVYVMIAAFENSVRELIYSTLEGTKAMSNDAQAAAGERNKHHESTSHHADANNCLTTRTTLPLPTHRRKNRGAE